MSLREKRKNQMLKISISIESIGRSDANRSVRYWSRDLLRKYFCLCFVVAENKLTEDGTCCEL
jgi:hypothetical protein